MYSFHALDKDCKENGFISFPYSNPTYLFLELQTEFCRKWMSADYFNHYLF